MSLESLVPDLDTCRRLKTAGYPQETVLWWAWNTHPLDGGWWVTNESNRDDTVAAPTFQEIWERLPTRLALNVRLAAMENEGKTGVGYVRLRGLDNWRVWFEGTVFAAAELWLWCKENGHLEGDKA